MHDLYQVHGGPHCPAWGESGAEPAAAAVNGKEQQIQGEEKRNLRDIEGRTATLSVVSRFDGVDYIGHNLMVEGVTHKEQAIHKIPSLSDKWWWERAAQYQP